MFHINSLNPRKYGKVLDDIRQDFRDNSNNDRFPKDVNAVVTMMVNRLDVVEPSDPIKAHMHNQTEDINGFVRGIHLVGVGLQGSLPAELSLLSNSLGKIGFALPLVCDVSANFSTILFLAF